MTQEFPSPRDDPKAVVDGHIITSQGPGTSLQFALKLVEKLYGEAAGGRGNGRLLTRHPTGGAAGAQRGAAEEKIRGYVYVPSNVEHVTAPIDRKRLRKPWSLFR